MGQFSDLMAIYCVTHSGTVSHRNCPLVTGPLDYGDPRGTGGIHRQTCPDVTQLLLIIQPVITKRRVLFIVQNPDGLCLKASRYVPLALFGFEFGFRFLFPLS